MPRLLFTPTSPPSPPSGKMENILGYGIDSFIIFSRNGVPDNSVSEWKEENRAGL